MDKIFINKTQENLKFIICTTCFLLILSTSGLLITACNTTSYVVTDDALDTNNNITLSGQIIIKDVEKDYDKSSLKIQILKLDKPISIIYKSNFGYEEKIDNVEELQVKYLKDKNISDAHMDITGEIKSGKNSSYGKDSYTDFVIITNYVR